MTRNVRLPACLQRSGSERNPHDSLLESASALVCFRPCWCSDVKFYSWRRWTQRPSVLAGPSKHLVTSLRICRCAGGILENRGFCRSVPVSSKSPVIPLEVRSTSFQPWIGSCCTKPLLSPSFFCFCYNPLPILMLPASVSKINTRGRWYPWNISIHSKSFTDRT